MFSFNRLTPTAPSPRPLVLLVDDELANRRLLQRGLSIMGYDCVLADSGSIAINMIRALSPHVVLLDVMMPEIDGLTILRELRADPAHANLAVIMLTGMTGGDWIRDALQEGADDFIAKPIDFVGLKARIDAVLARRRIVNTLLCANAKLDGVVLAQAIEIGEVRDLLYGRFSAGGKAGAAMVAIPATPAEAQAIPVDLLGEVVRTLNAASLDREAGG